ncbi:hypothetical protein [Thermoactinomyces sp. DSM 45892]|uniref:peptidase MA family metallohydrolase n=1 Tax=Thermoactinomyces sp. DSM 45892 TaxID=1882753 RepID=UPI0008992BE6|nr:hypothetical protein [Thermoactinomyces sp. DSM 45892]SDZ31382.1 hypothetical protein SAMN05444416_12081 [Thermoactinomyces sp. DSM 45892]
MNRHIHMRMIVVWIGVVSLGVGMYVSKVESNAATYIHLASSYSDDVVGIRQLIHKREQVLREGTWIDWTDWISPSSQSYFQEQKRWFDDAICYLDRGSYRLQLDKVETTTLGTVAYLKQSYMHHGKQVKNQYSLIVKYDPQKRHWVEVEQPFYQKKTTWGTLKVERSDLLRKEHVYQDAIDKGRAYFQQKLDWTPKPIEIKIFQRADHLAQSVKPSLPNWVGGWNEANQAIKLVSEANTSSEWEKSGIVHELTHQVISDLTHDNAAYWLQEGAAMYYEELLFPASSIKMRSEKIWSRAQLEKMNLENLSNQDAVRFYVSCREQYRQLLKDIGEGGMRYFFEEIRKYSRMDVDSSEKIQVCNQRTNRSLQKVFTIFKKRY